MTDKNTGLPYDIVESKDLSLVDAKVSPTEIGELMVSIVIARDLRLMNKFEAQAKIIKILNTLERLPKYRGFLFQWYDAKTGKGASNFIPSIDNLNFDAAMIVVASAFKSSCPLINKRIKKLLNKKDYSFFYRKINKNLAWLNHGYNKKEQSYSPYDYGHFLTEIALCVIPVLNKQLSEKILIDTQVPVRECRLLGDLVGLSWDGSLFNCLFSYLFMGYGMLPESIKDNLRKHVVTHIKYAEELNLPFWGWSPAWGSKGDRYVTWGVPELADWGGGYGVRSEIINKGYSPEFPEVSSYSSFLVLGVFNPKEKVFKEAIINLIKLKKSGYGYTQHGFYDAINTKDKKPSKYKVSLDEGIIIIGAYNALMHIQNKSGIESYFWKYFKEEEYKSAKRLFKNIGEQKFLKLASKSSTKKIKEVVLKTHKLISIDSYSIDKGGWGFGLASCVSREAFLDLEGKVWDLKYNIMEDFGGGYIKLGNIKSIDRYSYLILKVKKAVNDSTQGFQVELKESGAIFPPILKYSVTDLSSNKWRKYVIPIDYYINKCKKNVTPSELTIVFDPHITGTSKGNIYISDIWFYKE